MTFHSVCAKFQPTRSKEDAGEMEELKLIWELIGSSQVFLTSFADPDNFESDPDPALIWPNIEKKNIFKKKNSILSKLVQDF